MFLKIFTIALPLLLLTKCKSEHVMNCLKSVLNQHITSEDTIAFIYTTNNANRQFSLKWYPHEEKQNQLIKESMKVVGGLEVYSESQTILPPSDIRKQYKRDLIIIYCENYNNSIIIHLLKAIKSQRIFDAETKFLVILSIVNDKVIFQVFLEIWRYIRAFYTCVMVNNNNIIDFYHINPFQAGDFSWNKVNSWDGKFKQNVSIFPKMPKNFHNYKITLSYSPRPPFVISPVPPSTRPTGPEALIVTTIADHYNISLNCIFINMNTPLIDNGSFSGFWREIINHDIDLVINGALLFISRYYAASLIAPFDFDAIVVIVPKINIDNTWRSVYGAFHPIVWIVIVVSVVIFFIVFAYHKPDKILLVDVFFTIVRVHLEAAVDGYMLKNLSSALYYVLFTYALVIITYYKSKATTFRTLPKGYVPIQDLSDVNEVNLPFLFPKILYSDFFNDTFWRQLLSKGKFKLSYNLTYMAYEAVIRKKGAYLSGAQTGRYLVNSLFGDQGGETLYTVVPSFTIPNPVHSIMSPDNPLLPLFNKNTIRLVEGGFSVQWNKAAKYGLRIVQKSRGQTVITIDEIYFVFCILAGCLVSSSCVFLVEVLYKRMIL